MVLNGKYKLKKCKISFSVSGMTGEQIYEGEIQDDKINFKLRDEDSKKSVDRIYTFYAL
jgi:hypothetical protein